MISAGHCCTCCHGINSPLIWQEFAGEMLPDSNGVAAVMVVAVVLVATTIFFSEAVVSSWELVEL